MYPKVMIYSQKALESSHDCGHARDLRQRDAVCSVSRI